MIPPLFSTSRASDDWRSSTSKFGQVWIPHAVEGELQQIPDAALRTAIHQAQDAGWLIVRPAMDINLVSLLTVDLHQGEAEAIALALETKAERLLLDEKEGRLIARQLAVPVGGTTPVRAGVAGSSRSAAVAHP